MAHRVLLSVMGPLVLATYMPTCHTPVVHPGEPDAWQDRMSELWVQPSNLQERDLLRGRWGEEHAPDPGGRYRFVAPKLSGSNPGVVVRDAEGRKWNVKQPHPDRGEEGRTEVTLARVLEAVGYHQPPVYYLPSFRLLGDGPPRTVDGGRFRLNLKALDAGETWSWHENPFVGSRPYQGLLVILLLFNSSDLKDSNNILYRYTPAGGRPETWYVVRDLGMALGETGRIGPARGDIRAFERTRFVLGVEQGFVRFGYHGFHQELVTGRVTPGDVRWACDLLGGLSDRQWRDAFAAGGFEPPVATRFITRLQQRIEAGRAVGAVGDQ